MDQQRDAFGVLEAAARLGIGRSKLYEELASGRLRYVRIGRRTLIRSTELTRYLDELERLGPRATTDAEGRGTA